MNNWYLKKKNSTEIYGPYSFAKIRLFFEQKKLENKDLASCDQVNWKKIEDIFLENPLLEIVSPAEEKFDTYEIIKEIGQGAMGVVYKAKHVSLNRYCALKVIKKNAKEKPKQQFVEEAKAMAQLDHPNIVKIYDTGLSPMYFFAMELVDGITLTKWMEKKRPFKKQLSVFYKICQAVEYAHKKKIIHRDLKPDNIMIDNDNPKVMDFGIAKQLNSEKTFYQTGDIMGTPHYIAPETLNNFKADERSDLYALGVILYKMLTGRTPFLEKNATRLFFMVSTSEVPSPSIFNPKVNKDLEIICLHCLQINREKRYQSVALLRKEIERVLKNRAILTRPATLRTKIIQWSYQRPVLALLCVIIFIVAPLITSWFLYNEKQNNETLTKAKNQLAKIHEELKTVLDEKKNNLIKAHINTAKVNVVTKNYFNAIKNIKDAYDISKNLSKENYERSIYFALYTTLPNTPKLENTYTFLNFTKVFLSPNQQYFAGIYNADKPIFVCGKFLFDKMSYSLKDTFFQVACHDNGPIHFDKQSKKVYFFANLSIGVYDVAERKVNYPFRVDRELKKLVVSPDNNWLVTLEGETGKLFSLKNGAMHIIDESVKGDIVFSFDNSKIATCLENGISFWNIIEQKEIPNIAYLGQSFLKLAFNRDNNYIVASDSLNQLFLCDLRKRKEIIISERSSSIEDIQFNHDGRMFASLGKDKFLSLWDSSGRIIFILELKNKPLHFTFSTANKLLVFTKGANQVTLKKWNIENYLQKRFFVDDKRKMFIDSVKKSHSSEINTLFSQPILISPKQDIVVLPFFLGTFLWDKNGKFSYLKDFKTLMGSKKLYFTPDGKFLSKLTKKHEVIIFDIEAQKIIHKFSFPGIIRSISFSHDSEYLIVALYQKIIIHNLKNKKTQEFFHDKISCISTSPNGNWFVIAGDKNCEIWDNSFLQGKKNVIYSFSRKNINIIKWHQASNDFVCANDNGLTLFSLKKGNWEKRKTLYFPQKVENLSFSPHDDVCYLATFTRKDIVIFDLINDLSGKVYDGYFKGYGASIYPDWSKIAIPSVNGEILIFKMPTDIYSRLK